jgi:hypothetical protein
VATLALVSGTARADRTPYLFTEDSQIVPERTVELEQWLWAVGRVPRLPDSPVAEWLWWGPVLGVDEHLELRVPIQFFDSLDTFALASVGIDARYRIFPRAQDDGFQPLVRISYVQALKDYSGPPRIDLNLVATYGDLSSLRYTVNLGARLGIPPLAGMSGLLTLVGTAAIAASYPLPHEVRISGELFGQVPFLGSPLPGGQLYLGPSVSWTHGPFWLTAGSLFGLTHNSSLFLPRLLWAVLI